MLPWPAPPLVDTDHRGREGQGEVGPALEKPTTGLGRSTPGIQTPKSGEAVSEGTGSSVLCFESTVVCSRIRASRPRTGGCCRQPCPDPPLLPDSTLPLPRPLPDPIASHRTLTTNSPSQTLSPQLYGLRALRCPARPYPGPSSPGAWLAPLFSL